MHVKIAALGLAAMLAVGALAGCTTVKRVPGQTIYITNTAPGPTVDHTAFYPVTATVTHTVIRTVAPRVGPVTNGVTYRVTSDSGGANSITYTEGDAIEQVTNARLPWSKTVAPNSNLNQVSAQNSGGGSITCQIIGPDGTVADQHTSSGQYAIVSCQS